MTRETFFGAQIRIAWPRRFCKAGLEMGLKQLAVPGQAAEGVCLDIFWLRREQCWAFWATKIINRYCVIAIIMCMLYAYDVNRVIVNCLLDI